MKKKKLELKITYEGEFPELIEAMFKTLLNTVDNRWGIISMGKRVK